MAEHPFLVALVDDEPPARAKLRHYLEQYPRFRISGEAGSGAEAIQMITDQTPSLLFLDIELPDMSGFEVLRKCSLPPGTTVVFATAHEEHALMAFEAQAMDYLVKPISPIRFAQVMKRVEQRLADLQDAAVMRGLRPQTTAYSDRLTCRSGNRTILILVKDIVFIEAARNYAVIQVMSETQILRRTLESLERGLDPQRFVRISRSVIVNRDFIKAVEVVSHGDHRIELTTGHRLTWTRKYHGQSGLG